MVPEAGSKPFEPTNHPLRWFRPGYLSRLRGRPLEDFEFVALDFETTGLDPRRDRIVEVAACRFTPDGTILDEYASRVNPVTARAAATTQFHGLTNDQVTDSPTFGQVWPELKRLMSGAVVVAHNLRFEDDFLRHELRRLGADVDGRVPGVCMMVASWSHFRKFSYKQKLVFRTVVGTWPRDAHTALGDVRNLSAIFAGLYRRLPEMRYAGPPPISFGRSGTAGPMHARPIVEASIQWNSLPMAAVDYPVTDAAMEALHDGALRLLTSGCSFQLLIELMYKVGVGARQFARLLGTTLVSLLADGAVSCDWRTLSDLGALLDLMESQEIAEIVVDGVLGIDAFKGMSRPILAGERWRVPGDHPERDHLVEVLSGLGAQVLKTVRPNLTARVVRQTVERDGSTYDLHPYLAELQRRAADESGTYVREWAEEQRALYKASADVPLGDEPGHPEWDEIMAFEPRDPELAPDWRWAAKDYKEGYPEPWKHLDVADETPADEDEDWAAPEEGLATSRTFGQERGEALARIAAALHAVVARRAAMQERKQAAVAVRTVAQAAQATGAPAVARPAGNDVPRSALAPVVPLPGPRPAPVSRDPGAPRLAPPATVGAERPVASAGQAVSDPPPRQRRWPSAVFALAAVFAAFYAIWATVDAFRGERGALPAALLLWYVTLGFSVASAIFPRRRRPSGSDS